MEPGSYDILHATGGKGVDYSRDPIAKRLNVLTGYTRLQGASSLRDRAHEWASLEIPPGPSSYSHCSSIFMLSRGGGLRSGMAENAWEG